MLIKTQYSLVDAAGRKLVAGTTHPVYEPARMGWVVDYGLVTALPGEYSVLAETEVEEASNLTPTPMQFLLMLTGPEQVAIRKAAETDPYVQILVQMVDDTRLTFVELSNPTVIEAIQYLTTTTPALLTKERAARLLKGLGPVAAPADASESAS